jgi:hypothetical protein
VSAVGGFDRSIHEFVNVANPRRLIHLALVRRISEFGI